MPSPAFIARGGTDAEYEIYGALYATGRKETGDFLFKPIGALNLSFDVYSPSVGIKVGTASESEILLARSSTQRVVVIDNDSALSDARGALQSVLGG